VKGKNTLAIILSKRSGSDKLVKGKWSDMIVRLEKLVEMYRKGWISSGTAYEFQQLHLDLSGIGILHENEALNSEALRIIRRKRQSKSDEKLTANVLKQFETWFLTDMLSVSELAQEMIIAKEFAGSEELAQKPIKEVLKCKNG